jgi:hypothetical protein
MLHLVKRHLTVGNSPESDEGALMVRMHQDDLPKGTKWNNYVLLLVGDARIACRVRNNELVEVPHPRTHQININKDLRDVLQLKPGKVYDFYLKKASRWRAPLYVIRYHPSRKARRYMIAKVLATLVAAAGILGGVLCALLAS